MRAHPSKAAGDNNEGHLCIPAVQPAEHPPANNPGKATSHPCNRCKPLEHFYNDQKPQKSAIFYLFFDMLL